MGARARPPRPDGAPSRPGCAGSRGRAVPSSTARSHGSALRPAGATRGDTSRPPGRRPGSAATSIAPASGSGGRRQVVAAGPGEALGVGVIEDEPVQRQMVRGEGERAFEAVGPGRQCLARDVVEQVEVDRADARRPGGRDRVADVGHRMAPAELAELGGIEALGPERDPGDADLALRRGSPRSSGPGLASSVISAPCARPKRRRTRSTIAASASEPSSDGVPPPR